MDVESRRVLLKAKRITDDDWTSEKVLVCKLRENAFGTISGELEVELFEMERSIRLIAIS